MVAPGRGATVIARLSVAGGARTAEPAVAAPGSLALQGDQPAGHGAGLLHHGRADRPRIARFRQGPAAAAARADGDELLDPARAARPRSRYDETSVLSGDPGVVPCRTMAVHAGPQEILAVAGHRHD